MAQNTSPTTIQAHMATVTVIRAAGPTHRNHLAGTGERRGELAAVGTCDRYHRHRRLYRQSPIRGASDPRGATLAEECET